MFIAALPSDYIYTYSLVPSKTIHFRLKHLKMETYKILY